ncbi:MAG: hypothetical protein ACM3H9_09155, partial [Rhodospirillaceae bacterium]
YAEAFAVCKEVVDRFLRHEYVPGMPASALYLRYMMLGRNPCLVEGADGAEAQPGFSAWDYARARCADLCDASPLAAALDVAWARGERPGISVEASGVPTVQCR